MNRNEEVKPSFLAEFTPHKSTKKNGTRTLLAGKFRKDPQETPPPRIIRPVTENRKQKTEIGSPVAAIEFISSLSIIRRDNYYLCGRKIETS